MNLETLKNWTKSPISTLLGAIGLLVYTLLDWFLKRQARKEAERAQLKKDLIEQRQDVAEQAIDAASDKKDNQKILNDTLKNDLEAVEKL